MNLEHTLHDHLECEQRAFGAAAYRCHTKWPISQSPQNISEAEVQCLGDEVLKDIFKGVHGWQALIQVLGHTCGDLRPFDFRNLRFGGSINRSL